MDISFDDKENNFWLVGDLGGVRFYKFWETLLRAAGGQLELEEGDLLLPIFIFSIPCLDIFPIFSIFIFPSLNMNTSFLCNFHIVGSLFFISFTVIFLCLFLNNSLFFHIFIIHSYFFNFSFLLPIVIFSLRLNVFKKALHLCQMS